MIRDTRQNIVITDNMYINEYNKNENYVITDGKKNIIDLEIDDNKKSGMPTVEQLIKERDNLKL